MHADQDPVLVQLGHRAAKALDAVGIAALVEREVAHARAPGAGVEHHLPKARPAAVVDHLVDVASRRS